MDEPVRILCVDDEKNILKSLRRLFMDENYEILTAASGRQGLDILEAEGPVQVVISDYRMPEMNGVDFLRQVCEQWPDTVRIVLSGYGDTAVVVAAINEGRIYKFIPKPWNDDELKVTIAKAVEVYFLHQQNLELARGLQQSNDELRRLNENLEQRVKERTSELEFRNKVLLRSQNILDTLPVAVLGLDTDGLIVQCNQEGETLLGGEGRSPVGMTCQEVLPAALADFVGTLNTGATRVGRIAVGGRDVAVRGRLMRGKDDQEGVILVLADTA